MTWSMLGRWTLVFWMEALLTASVLMLFRWLPARPESMIGFVLAAALLLALGSWLYQGGGHHLLLHLLLYPLVAAVGGLCYAAFGSWLLALLLAALFFWRIHAAPSIPCTPVHLRHRFVLALIICLFQLVLAGLFGALAAPQPHDVRAYYAILAFVLASHLVTGWGEYLTREPPGGSAAPISLAAALGGQLLTTRLLLAAGYALAGGGLLWLLAWIWGLVKEPLGDGLYLLARPLLLGTAALFGKLAEVLSGNSRVNGLFNSGTDVVEQPLEEIAPAGGETLFSMAEPYLIACVSALVLATLARFIWKRRYRNVGGTAVSPAPVQTAWRPVAADASADEGPLWELDTLMRGPSGPVDDPVRYAYYRFLQHMAESGMRIERHETSHEYLRRIRSQWANPDVVELAGQITGYYERYRYRQQPLSPEEWNDLEQCLRKLRDSSKRE
ncbi:DUF4129 domain-containing protein [Brevibacillus thermoruber]|uniref:DUF4129 domain-containing protein n=1 Tax=Brevibacillus thermoruber TaxID=33942 RepID=UPI0004036569|nr:DUF4129 domain-containing protein [Brevibacillus thermoruber]